MWDSYVIPSPTPSFTSHEETSLFVGLSHITYTSVLGGKVDENH